MELNLGRSFVAVAEAGHLTRAADRLDLSQPAVSAQIKALEGALDLDLFARHAQGMALTPAGQRPLGQAQKLLAAAQAFRNEARAIKGEVSGIATVGTVSDPQFIRVAGWMSAAVERYPRLEIRLHHEVSGAAFEKVRDGALDASFYDGDLTDPAVTALPLRDITYRIVAPAAWASRLDQASWPDIAAEPWVMTPAISTHHQLAGRLFREHGITPTKVVEADDEFVVTSLVESGLGMGLMREDLAEARTTLGPVCLWSDVRLSTTLQFITRLQREGDPVTTALLQALRDVWTFPKARPATGRRARRPAPRAAA